ncbi:DUF6402 family protein [Enterobacter hormaechei]|nr:DUF6402 family protein [Enterobacter hormaechei]
MTVSSTTTTKEREQQAKKVSVVFFHIDMIPDAMRNMGWEMAPKLMEHWFEISPAFAFTTESKIKSLDEDARNLPLTQVSTEIIKMVWAMKFEQVSAGIEELTGRWKSTKGIARLKNHFLSKGDFNKNVVSLGYTDDVMELDRTSQVNLIPIGSKLDTINDWYDAMGDSNLKVCIRGMTQTRQEKTFFIVDKLGFYLKDTYDFVDEGNSSEPLGVWSKNRIFNKEETGIYISTYLSGLWGHLVRNFSGFVPVFNKDFRKWQGKHDSGGDYIVFSDVLWLSPRENDKEIPL